MRQPGSDAKEGDKVLDKGTVIGSGGGEVGLLGFVGKREVCPGVSDCDIGHVLTLVGCTGASDQTSQDCLAIDGE